MPTPIRSQEWALSKHGGGDKNSEEKTSETGTVLQLYENKESCSTKENRHTSSSQEDSPLHVRLSIRAPKGSVHQKR